MQISSVKIDNFKSIRHLEIDFVDPFTKKIRPITAIFGDNGSGKTSVLQAIALTISMVTRRIEHPDEFQWHGFLYDRINSFGDTRIEVNIRLEDDEINAVQEIYELWRSFLPPQFLEKKMIPPNREKDITLVFESGNVKASGGFGDMVELLGRYYTKTTLVPRDHTYRSYFDRVGDVFWFDQYRNLGSGSFQTLEKTETPTQQMSWQAGIEGLREFLVGWWHRHQYSTNKPEDDFILKLEERFSRIFIDAKFDGLEPMPMRDELSPPGFYFMISREGTRYDISEMSSGEQAVFCVLYEFVRLRIARSIVLIDELELHLHPPEQQAMYNALKKLGANCQYIITSHSPYLDAIIPEEYKIHLRGGQRWL